MFPHSMTTRSALRSLFSDEIAQPVASTQKHTVRQGRGRRRGDNAVSASLSGDTLRTAIYRASTRILVDQTSQVIYLSGNAWYALVNGVRRLGKQREFAWLLGARQTLRAGTVRCISGTAERIAAFQKALIDTRLATLGQFAISMRPVAEPYFDEDLNKAIAATLTAPCKLAV